MHDQIDSDTAHVTPRPLDLGDRVRGAGAQSAMRERKEERHRGEASRRTPRRAARRTPRGAARRASRRTARGTAGGSVRAPREPPRLRVDRRQLRVARRRVRVGARPLRGRAPRHRWREPRWEVRDGVYIRTDGGWIVEGPSGARPRCAKSGSKRVTASCTSAVAGTGATASTTGSPVTTSASASVTTGASRAGRQRDGVYVSVDGSWE